MEHIVASHIMNIMNYADNTNILYPLQHGFRSKRSCETQLIEFIYHVTNSLASGRMTYVLIMDFDKVSHS